MSQADDWLNMPTLDTVAHLGLLYPITLIRFQSICLPLNLLLITGPETARAENATFNRKFFTKLTLQSLSRWILINFPESISIKADEW